MKKIISVVLIAILMFSAISCLSVGAVSGSTDDEAADFDLQVKEDAYECFYKGIIDVEIDDIIITYAGTLSNGSLILNVTYSTAAHLDAIYTDTIGDYYYDYCPSDPVYIYRDHKFYNIINAYNIGLIDDNTLEEIYEINKEYSKHPCNDWVWCLYPITDDTEPTTQITTESVTQSATTEPITQSETKATSSESLTSSTSDTAQAKAPATSDTATIENSNGTVQTGQSNLLIVLVLLFVASAMTAAVFMKFRYRD